MGFDYLSAGVKLSQAVTVAAGASGTTNIVGATLDMSNYEGVLMVVPFGPITSGAATSIKAQQGDASDLSDAADIVGTSQTVADDADNTTFYIDLKKPASRYVRLYVLRATQASTCCGTYIQYGAASKPTTQGTSVSGEQHQNAADGTA